MAEHLTRAESTSGRPCDHRAGLWRLLLSVCRLLTTPWTFGVLPRYPHAQRTCIMWPGPGDIEPKGNNSWHSLNQTLPTKECVSGDPLQRDVPQAPLLPRLQRRPRAGTFFLPCFAAYPLTASSLPDWVSPAQGDRHKRNSSPSGICTQGASDDF